MRAFDAPSSTHPGDHFDFSDLGEIEQGPGARLAHGTNSISARFSVVALDDRTTVEEVSGHPAISHDPG